MSEEKLGPMPTPQAEPGPENPGGADAINDDVPFAGEKDDLAGRDLNPENNPQVEDHVPDEISQPDDKKQEGEGDGASNPEEEDPV
jgi:hypothetical protein